VTANSTSPDNPAPATPAQSPSGPTP
jgi:hypothetical protein